MSDKLVCAVKGGDQCLAYRDCKDEECREPQKESKIVKMESRFRNTIVNALQRLIMGRSKK